MIGKIQVVSCLVLVNYSQILSLTTPKCKLMPKQSILNKRFRRLVNISFLLLHNIYDMKSWIRPYVSFPPFSTTDPLTFFVLQKMKEVRWKWCSVFWLVTSKRSGYQRKTIHHHERCASWVSNFTETRECQKCDARCYGESY